MQVSAAYLYRPAQVVRRAKRPTAGHANVRVPWGTLTVNVDEHMGAGIARRGIHEPAITEALWRLTRPGDLALDVGANFGYFTTLLHARGARVIAFEPERHVLATLQANTNRLPNATVETYAVSDHVGTATLVTPDGFRANQGIATIGSGDGEPVETTTLDSLIDEPVGVMKIDIEGHELAALHGAERLLSERLIRHIVFEDHHARDSEVFALLRSHGYAIFGLRESLRGVALVDPLSPKATASRDAPNYLATATPRDARRAFHWWGWRSLLPHRR